MQKPPQAPGSKQDTIIVRQQKKKQVTVAIIMVKTDFLATSFISQSRPMFSILQSPSHSFSYIHMTLYTTKRAISFCLMSPVIALDPHLA